MPGEALASRLRLFALALCQDKAALSAVQARARSGSAAAGR